MITEFLALQDVSNFSRICETPRRAENVYLTRNHLVKLAPTMLQIQIEPHATFLVCKTSKSLTFGALSQTLTIPGSANDKCL